MHQYNLDEASTADILEVLAHTLRESFEFSAHFTSLEGLLQSVNQLASDNLPVDLIPVIAMKGALRTLKNT